MAGAWDTPNNGASTFGTPSTGGFGASPAPAPAFGSNLFFNPNNNYGATNGGWYNTPLGAQLREQTPQLAYQYYGGQQGIGNTDTAFNQWFQQQYPRFQQAYGMATVQNPLITIDQFMKTLPNMQQLQGQFQQLSPDARGESARNFAPQARWIGR